MDKLCHINNILIFYLYHTLLISSKLAKSENLPQFYFHSTLVLKFIQIYIKITDIVDVVSYLKTFKTKNLGQNKDNLINYLSKDYGYNKESANKVIEKAVKENVVRIVLLNGKNSYRIVENGENTMIVPETQLSGTQLNDADTTEAISEEKLVEKTVVGTPAHMLNDEIISTLEKKFEAFSESIESRLLNIEEQIIGARDSRIEKIGDDNPDNAFSFKLIEKSHF